MATLRQFYYRVLENGSFQSQYPGQPESFFERNLLESEPKGASKISIQAPPGTEILLNNKRIIVGRSGLYDFDNDDVPAVTSLVFPQPVKYIRSDIDYDYLAELQSFLTTIRGYIVTLGNTMDYQKFCTDGQLIYMGEKIDQSKYNFYSEEQEKTLHGFYEVLQEYLKTLQGELEIENIDIMNVVVNYVTSD